MKHKNEAIEKAILYILTTVDMCTTEDVQLALESDFYIRARSGAIRRNLDLLEKNGLIESMTGRHGRKLWSLIADNQPLA